MGGHAKYFKILHLEKCNISFSQLEKIQYLNTYLNKYLFEIIFSPALKKGKKYMQYLNIYSFNAKWKSTVFF